MINQNHGLTDNHSGYETGKFGSKILILDNDIDLKQVTKFGNGENSTHCYLYDSGGIVTGNCLATGSFSGLTASFDNTLTANTYYYIVVDKEGSGYTSRDYRTTSFPYVNSHINWVAGYANAVDRSDILFEIQSIDIDVIEYNLISDVIFMNNETITTATFTPTFITSGDSQYGLFLSADSGNNWESVDSGSAHTFTNTGQHLMYQVTGNNITLSGIKIEY